MKENNDDKSVYIIGAGISGLIAAINLEQEGYSPVILESTDCVGGRVKTDLVAGYQLDHGFQVLLDAYPMAKKYLDYDTLNLQPLMPGAMIQKNERMHAFGDPLRSSDFLFPTILSSLGTLSDKWKIFKLKTELAKQPIESLFQKEEKTTLNYLQDYGFSDNIIQHFFRPFFAGIFLEPNLETSSRMFEFVYKMFGEGQATIPYAGMSAIPRHLKTQLKKTTFRFETPVQKVTNEHIHLASGEVLEPDFTIIATDPGTLMPNYTSTLEWKSCDNLYFTVPSRNIDKPIIGLNPDSSKLINNIFYSSSIACESKGPEELLSVTVVNDHNHVNDALIAAVQEELKTMYEIESATFLKHYEIKQALPKLNDLQYIRDDGESLVTERIAVCGDHQLNGSLNAAMTSGEAAARTAHRAITEMTITLS